jgi:hypothetical protein
MLWMTYGVRRSQWAGNRPGRMDSDQAGSWEEGLHWLQGMSGTRHCHSHFALLLSASSESPENTDRLIHLLTS